MFESNHKAVELKTQRACIKSLYEIGALIMTDAKLRCPVDTGNLRRSITHEIDDLIVEIGTNVHYAPHVEYGTKRTKAQPFLRPAGDNNRDKALRIFRRNLKAMI